MDLYSNQQMHSPRATVNSRLGIKDKPHLLCDPWWSEANHAIPGAPVKHCSGPLTHIPPTYVCLQANTSNKSTTVVQFKPSDTNVFCIPPTTNSFARRNRQAMYQPGGQLQASNWTMRAHLREKERQIGPVQTRALFYSQLCRTIEKGKDIKIITVAMPTL